jgi:hypothetical protein
VAKKLSDPKRRGKSRNEFGRKHFKEDSTGRPGHRGQNNIKTYFKGTGRKTVDSTELAHYKDQWPSLIKMVMNLEVP